MKESPKIYAKKWRIFSILNIFANWCFEWRIEMSFEDESTWTSLFKCICVYSKMRLQRALIVQTFIREARFATQEEWFNSWIFGGFFITTTRSKLITCKDKFRNFVFIFYLRWPMFRTWTGSSRKYFSFFYICLPPIY